MESGHPPLTTKPLREILQRHNFLFHEREYLRELADEMDRLIKLVEAYQAAAKAVLS
jgi:hypothetical protein